MEMTRSFLAFQLPPEAIEAAGAVLAQLRRQLGDRDVKWVAPALLHVTLRFFGDLDPEALARAREWTRGQEAAWEAIPAGWSDLGAFPSPRRAQVLWLGLADETGRLRAQAAEVERGLVQAGFGRGDKPFVAHVTLGRVRRGARIAPPADSERLTSPRTAFSIARMVLVKSTLTPSGPVYTPLETAEARSR